jgi:hypothetical protein
VSYASSTIEKFWAEIMEIVRDPRSAAFGVDIDVLVSSKPADRDTSLHAANPILRVSVLISGDQCGTT